MRQDLAYGRQMAVYWDWLVVQEDWIVKPFIDAYWGMDASDMVVAFINAFRGTDGSSTDLSTDPNYPGVPYFPDPPGPDESGVPLLQ